jgi:hypothetical protein
MAAGIDQASVELLGLGVALDSRSRKREDHPLLHRRNSPPLLELEAGNVRGDRVGWRARRAVRIHARAIGPEALRGPTLIEMAAITDGIFTPVRDPGAWFDSSTRRASPTSKRWR